MPAFRDLTGQTYGYLTVKRKALVTQGKKIKYICDCVCGNETVVAASNLTNGHTISCGCKRGYTRGRQLLLPYGESAKRDLYRKYKDSAIRRKYVFELTFDEFIHITSHNCEYCGRQPSTVAKRAKSVGFYIHNGVDRIDNDKGYTVDNVVACCTICNRAKGTLSLEEFNMWIKDISNHNKEVTDAAAFKTAD